MYLKAREDVKIEVTFGLPFVSPQNPHITALFIISVFISLDLGAQTCK